jgi:hypothetical protein
VWIAGAVPLSLRALQAERRLKDDPTYTDKIMQLEFSQLRQQMCEYVKSIMSSNFQCPERFLACPIPECAASEAPVGELQGPHFSQIDSGLQQYRRPLKAGSKVKSDPPICLCARSGSSMAFSVQSVTRTSVIRARSELGMPAVNFELKDSYNQLEFAQPISIVPPPPANALPGDESILQYTRYLVELATVQLACMEHDPAHRSTCTKKGQKECRFHFPQKATTAAEDAQGPVIFKYHQKLSDDGTTEVDDYSKPPISCDVVLPRSGIDAYTVQCSLPVSATFRCNNDVKYVHSPGTAFYITMYHVKTHDEEAAHARDVFNALEKAHMRKLQGDAAADGQASVPSAIFITPRW